MSLFSKKNLFALCLFAAMELLALRFIFGQLVISPARVTWDQMCPRSYKPPLNPSLRASYAHLSYTGIQGIDLALCKIVAFFTETMKPRGLPVATSMLSSFTSINAFLFIEAARNNRSAFISLPAVIGSLLQLFTAGAIMPLYWVLFILSDSNRMVMTGKMRHIDHREALRILIALIAAYIIPLYFLFERSTPFNIILWNIFPITMTGLRWILKYLIPPSDSPKSGTAIVYVTYCVSLLAGIIPHLRILSKYEELSLLHTFLPTWTGADSKEITQMGTLLFIWDNIFAFGSSALASLWFAQNREQLVALAILNTIAIPAIGPGAAFAIVMLWREGVLSSQQQEVKKEE